MLQGFPEIANRTSHIAVSPATVTYLRVCDMQSVMQLPRNSPLAPIHERAEEPVHAVDSRNGEVRGCS
jgi:hypothetical protein